MSVTKLQDRFYDQSHLPSGILMRRPLPDASPNPTPPLPQGNEPPSGIHPFVIIAALAGSIWFLLVFWVTLAGNGYMGLTMTLATLIFGVMIGVMTAGGSGAHSATPWQRPWRSFGEFLSGTMETWTGRESGRDATLEVAGLSWALAALATAFGLIIALVR